MAAGNLPENDTSPIQNGSGGNGLIRATSPRVRGLAPWSPQAKTIFLLDQVRAVLREYEAYLPLTIRQIFYRLIGAYDYPKTQLAYDNLGEHLNRARRAGIIPFEHIRDDSAAVETAIDWAGVAELLKVWRWQVKNFKLDRQLEQLRRLIIMVEAAGMKPQIEALVENYSIPVIPCGGFDSLTVKHELARALGKYDGTTEVLHIGDHDPSGAHVFLSAAEDVEALIADLGLPGIAVFTRLAVTPAQIAALSLPTKPANKKDNRAFAGEETVQAEAIPPDILARIVTDAVRERVNDTARKRLLTREKRCRAWLTRQLSHIDLGDAP
jgi:hypothetical protein